MDYGGKAGYPTSKTLGIYVPLKCSGDVKNALPSSWASKHSQSRGPEEMHATLVEEVTEAAQIIMDMRAEEIQRNGLDPDAIRLLPTFALYP